MYKKFEIKATFGYETEWKEQNPDHATNPEKKDEYLDIENKIWKGCKRRELVGLYEKDGKRYSRMVITNIKRRNERRIRK